MSCREQCVSTATKLLCFIRYFILTPHSAFFSCINTGSAVINFEEKSYMNIKGNIYIDRLPAHPTPVSTLIGPVIYLWPLETNAEMNI